MHIDRKVVSFTFCNWFFRSVEMLWFKSKCTICPSHSCAGVCVWLCIMWCAISWAFCSILICTSFNFRCRLHSAARMHFHHQSFWFSSKQYLLRDSSLELLIPNVEIILLPLVAFWAKISFSCGVLSILELVLINRNSMCLLFSLLKKKY